jgi:hypothetical protein
MNENHPIPSSIRDMLHDLRVREAQEQKRLRLGKTPYQHKQEHTTLDIWIDEQD